MKFKPSALSLALSLALFSASQQAVELDKIELPDMGDSSGTLITPAQEQELGAAFFRSLHNQISISQDAELQQYIETIGQRLAANSDTPGYPFHFFVVMSNEINAFAGPGGYIGVNSGLILTTEAESELASVMAHEVAHVTQRHLYRAFEAASRLSLPTAAATLAAILLGTQAPALGQAAMVAIQAGNVQYQIDFTRENEEEADRVGMQTLADSQYDPRSMPIFFERLQQSTRYYGKDIPEFLRTHPVTTARISDTRGRAENYPYKQYPDSLGYQLAKAKIRVLTTTNPNEVLTYFQNALKQGTAEQRTVARYGLGLAQLSLQKFNEATATFQELSKEHPDQPQYAVALARTTLEAKNYPTALAQYQNAMALFPNNEAIKLEYIRSLLKAGDAELARKNLISLKPKTQQQPLYFELLAQTYSDLHQAAESHRYLAEYYYAMGQTKDAVLQIKLAQKSPGLNFYLSSILGERLKFFIEELEAAKRDR
jgi:beta-barrel assembly-enhancing protease